MLHQTDVDAQLVIMVLAVDKVCHRVLDKKEFSLQEGNCYTAATQSKLQYS